MNIIELVKSILTEYPKMQEFTGDIHVDFTESESDNFGISSTGDALVKRDILGNEDRKHSFVLYAVNQGINDYQRLENSSFLLELGYWLEKVEPQKFEYEVAGKLMKAELQELSSANAMIFNWQTEQIGGPVTYQIQIYAKYKVESEDD